MFYLHPWEIEPEQPRATENVPLPYLLRHYTNLDHTERRLDDLLERFDWRVLDARFDRERGTDRPG